MDTGNAENAENTRGNEVKINVADLFYDLGEFGKLQNSNRNKNDLRLGQWFCTKYGIVDNQRLFYTESYADCYTLIREQYLKKITTEE
jgi:hypothetical protein